MDADKSPDPIGSAIGALVHSSQCAAQARTLHPPQYGDEQVWVLACRCRAYLKLIAAMNPPVSEVRSGVLAKIGGDA